MDALAAAHPDLEFAAENGKISCEAPAGRYRFDYKPVRPLHRVISIDLTVPEVLAIPEAKAALLEVFPELAAMSASPPPMGPISLRGALTRNPFMKFPPERVEQLAQRLAALDA